MRSTQLQARVGRTTGAVARTPASTRRLVARAAAVQVDSKDAVIEKQVHEFLSKLPPGARRVNAKEFEEPIEKLKKLGEELQLNHVIPERLVGCIHGRLTTDQREFEGDVTTLGRAAFSLFGPKDLKIDLAPSSVDAKLEATGLPGFYRGPFEDMKNGYILFNLFKIVDERAGSGEPLYGIINVIAEYGVPTDDKPKNICTVQFKEMRLLPSPEVAADPALFARWKELFKPHNETMDERGCADTKLPKSPLGTLEYFMCGNKYQLQRGNLGTYTILEMYQPEPGSKKAQYVQQFASQSYFSPIPGK